jgi:hypothetical protein
MHIKRKYRELEKVEEVRVYNFNKVELLKNAPQVKDPGKVRFSNIMKHVPSDINVFTPIDGGEDFIVERVGWSILERANAQLINVEGRKLSQVSPFYYEIFKDGLKEVYETNKTKTMRIFYYNSDRISNIANVHIAQDEDEIYIISDILNKIDEEEKTLEEQKKRRRRE